jgi:DNA-binding IclR family transcriptional regulator
LEKSVVKALKLLEVLSGADAPEGVSALARKMQINKSNVHRLLQTLVDWGYVRRADELGNYELTLKMWQMGREVLARREIAHIAPPHLKWLLEHTGESASLSILEEERVIYLSRIECGQPVRAHNPVGVNLPVHCSSGGKAILAFQPEEVIGKQCGALKKYTEHTITSRARLLEELKRVRSKGYAVNRGEFRAGVHGVAAPVRGADGSVGAAVGVSGPSERFKPQAIRRFAEQVVRCAERISSELGYR